MVKMKEKATPSPELEFHAEKLARCCFFCRKCYLIRLGRMHELKAPSYMTHFATLGLDDALVQVRSKNAPEYVCGSCHDLLTRANEVVDRSRDRGDLPNFPIPSVIKFESWEPHTSLANCRVCSSPDVNDEGRYHTSTSPLISSTPPRSLIGESTLLSTANRIILLILKLYDSFDSLEEDPVDAAFAFLLAVISEAESSVRRSLAKAWEGYVKIYKEKERRRKRKAERKKREASNTESPAKAAKRTIDDVDFEDADPNESTSSSTPKKPKWNTPTEFSRLLDYPPPVPEFAAAAPPPPSPPPPAVVKTEVMEGLQEAAEAIFQNQLVPADYFDPLQLLLNQYRLNILRTVDPRFVDLFSRVPVVRLKRIDAVLSSASWSSPSFTASSSSSSPSANSRTGMVVTIYPESSKNKRPYMDEGTVASVTSETVGVARNTLRYPEGVKDKSETTARLPPVVSTAFNPRKKMKSLSKSKTPSETKSPSKSKSSKSPIWPPKVTIPSSTTNLQMKKCALCDYKFKLNVVKEILAHKRFCGDWAKIEEELKHNTNKKKDVSNPVMNGEASDLEEHEEAEEEEEVSYEELLRIRGFQRFRGFETPAGMRLRAKKRRRNFDEPVTEEELREEEESDLFEEQFRAMNDDEIDDVETAEDDVDDDDDFTDEYAETMETTTPHSGVDAAAADAATAANPPTTNLRDINSSKYKRRAKSKKKDLGNDFFEVDKANLKVETFDEEADAILNFDEDLENLENIGDGDYLQVSDMENEISDLSDWDDEDDEEGVDDDYQRFGGNSLPRTASSSCPTCNKSFVNQKGKLRAGVAKRMAASDPDLIANHSLRCSKRETKKLLIPCRLCLTMIVANRLCRLKHYRKHHPETILICPVNGCGTRLVDDTSDFQYHIRRDHSEQHSAPVFVSDGYQVFERDALDIEGWSDDFAGTGSVMT